MGLLSSYWYLNQKEILTLHAIPRNTKPAIRVQNRIKNRVKNRVKNRAKIRASQKTEYCCVKMIQVPPKSPKPPPYKKRRQGDPHYPLSKGQSTGTPRITELDTDDEDKEISEGSGKGLGSCHPTVGTTPRHTSLLKVKLELTGPGALKVEVLIDYGTPGPVVTMLKNCEIDKGT